MLTREEYLEIREGLVRELSFKNITEERRELVEQTIADIDRYVLEKE